MQTAPRLTVCRRHGSLSFAAAVLLLSVVICAVVHAEVKLPAVLADNMVLQRGVPVAIWGTAAPGESVHVSFGGSSAATAADTAGRWSIHLGPFAASAEPRTLEIDATNHIALHNVVVGEVWLASGQSNMEFAMGSNLEPVVSAGGVWSVPRDTMRRPPAMAVDLAAANDPQMRLYKQLKGVRSGGDTSHGWQAVDPHSLSDFSAVAYYFGRRLRTELNVPIGLIETTWGGSRIELWTAAEAYAASPAFPEAAASPERLDGSPAGTYWRSMVQPLVPYTLKGFLWYQGESNVLASTGASRYEQKMQVLIESWRAAWGDTDRRAPRLPFYFVQIAPLAYARRSDAAAHPPDAYPLLHEQQTLTLAIPRTGMAVVTDLVNDLNDIHPSNKVDVADRLARWTLAKDYARKNVVYTGPIYRMFTIEKGTITLSFDHAAGGLATRDAAPPTCFTIAGEDGVFLPAQARIETAPVRKADIGRITVWSDAVPAPRAVRFAWSETDQPNLTNAAGLPALPFRTDGPAIPPVD